MLVSGTAYYVDCSRASNGDGTLANPWNTLTSPNTKPGGFGPGDQLLFKKDTTCNGQLAPAGSGAAGAPFLISSYGTGTSNPLIAGGGLQDAATVYLFNMEHIEVSNLRISNKPAGPSPVRGQFRGLWVRGDNAGILENIYIHDNEVFDVFTCIDDIAVCKTWTAMQFNTANSATLTRFDNLRIENNIVHDVGSTAIATSTGRASDTDSSGYITNLVVRGNTIYNGQADGIIVRYATSPLIEYNTVRNTGQRGALASGNLGTVALWVRGTTNALVQFNEVSGHGNTGSDGQAFDADLGARDTIFQYNYTYNNYGGFLLTWNTSSGTIARYNISIDDTGARGLLALNTPATLYNNVFVERSTTDSNYVMYQHGGVGSTLRNNIFWRGRAPTNFKRVSSLQNGVWNNNTFYYVNGAHPADDPADTNKLITDPLFLSITAPTAGLNSVSGYRLRVGSPALNSGVLIASNGGRDYFGNTVSSTAAPNRGFYQGPGLTGNTVTLTAEADAYVQDGAQASTNFGTATNLLVKGGTAAGFRRETYLRFNLSSIATVSSARLRVYGRNVQDSVGVPLSVYSVADDSWLETGVTWNLRPAQGATALGSTSVGSTLQYYEIDVTAFVNGQLADDRASFLLEDSAIVDRTLSFNSRETGSNPPQLVIVQ